MQLINTEAVQRLLDSLKNQDVYLHLEMTTGAYAAHRDKTKLTAAAFIRNGKLRYSRGLIAGSGPYRIGLKTEEGWVYAEGLTHWDETEADRLILAGHDQEDKLVVSLQLSRLRF